MDPCIWICDTELRIPGVKGEHVFLHISDTHLCAADEM